MPNNLFSLPPVLISLGIIIGGALIGFFYFLSIIKKSKDDDKKQSNDDIKTAEAASSYVTNALEKKIIILEGLQRDNEKKIHEQELRLIGIEKENGLLREILQGKDKDNQAYQAAAREAFKKADQVFEIVTNTNKSVEKLYKAIEKHLSILEKQSVVTVTTGGIENTLGTAI